MDDATSTILIVAVVLALLALAVVLLIWAVRLLGDALVVAAHLFEWASGQGFIGVAVYIACWVFMFPVMLVVCVVMALFARSVVKANELQGPDPDEPRDEAEAQEWEEWDRRYRERLRPKDGDFGGR